MKLLECPLCLSLMCEPITTMCGHTFCRVCLTQTLARCKKKCPACRSICIIDAKNHPENIMIASIIKSLHPEIYKEREKDVGTYKQQWNFSLPVFFFNHTLFPTCQLRLRLFEPRYLHMIKRVQSTRRFVYLPNFEDYRAHKGDIGVVLHIEECSYAPSGVAMVCATAKERIRVTDTWVEDGTNGLCYCTYEVVNEETGANEAHLQKDWKQLQEMIEKFLSSIDENSTDILCGDLGPSPETAENGSFWSSALVARIIHNDEFALNMLQLTATKERLQTCQHILGQVLSSLGDEPSVDGQTIDITKLGASIMARHREQQGGGQGGQQQSRTGEV